MQRIVRNRPPRSMIRRKLHRPSVQIIYRPEQLRTRIRRLQRMYLRQSPMLRDSKSHGQRHVRRPDRYQPLLTRFRRSFPRAVIQMQAHNRVTLNATRTRQSHLTQPRLQRTLTSQPIFSGSVNQYLLLINFSIKRKLARLTIIPMSNRYLRTHFPTLRMSLLSLFGTNYLQRISNLKGHAK